MRKKFVSILLAGVMAVACSFPVFASIERTAERYNQESIDLSAKELQEKKDTVQVPEIIDERIATFVQDKKDMWSVLSKNLNESDYGGKYVKDGVLHIKIINQDNVSETIKKILEFVPQKIKNMAESVVIETDAIYSVEQLEKMMDDLSMEDCERLHIYGIGIKSSINGLTVDSDEWTEEKKKEVSEILGIDINHIEFGISTGLYYGDTPSTLEKGTRDTSSTKSSFTPIKEKLNINCAEGDVEELINYLEKEIKEFDRETVSLTRIQKTSDSESYDIFFNKKYNGFDTYYYVYVVADEKEGLKYYSNLSKFKHPKENIVNCSEISQEVIETAKKEAIKNINLKENDMIESQDIELKINVEFKPFICVTSHVKEKEGTYFSKSFIYYI